MLRAERELLDQADDFELPRRFSAAERQQPPSGLGPRIAEPGPADRYGLADTGGRAAAERRWRNARTVDSPAHEQAGAAMVAAALDCRRAGLSRPVSEEVLVGCTWTRPTWTRESPAALDPASFEQGLAWATESSKARALCCRRRGGRL